MLAKQNRITENRDFLRIFKAVRPVHTEHLAIRVAKRAGGKPTEGHDSSTAINNEAMERWSNERSASRFGFVISNKIDKRATRRNGLKRRIRAIIEDQLPRLLPGVDVVIQVKKPFDYPYDFKNIEMEVREGLKRAGVLK